MKISVICVAAIAALSPANVRFFRLISFHSEFAFCSLALASPAVLNAADS